MGRNRSRSRSRSSKHSSSSYKKSSYRGRSRSVERDSKSSRDRDRRRRSRSNSKYSSSRSSKTSHHQSSRRRRRSSSYSSSESSYSSNSSRSPSPERKLAKKVEKVNINSVEQPKPEPVFDSVNFLHDKDKKDALDDLDNEGFVQKSFNSSSTGNTKTTVDLNAQTISVPKAKEPPPVDTLLHHGVRVNNNIY